MSEVPLHRSSSPLQTTMCCSSYLSQKLSTLNSKRTKLPLLNVEVDTFRGGLTLAQTNVISLTCGRGSVCFCLITLSRETSDFVLDAFLLMPRGGASRTYRGISLIRNSTSEYGATWRQGTSREALTARQHPEGCTGLPRS
jgi:hypothetical protein